MLTSLPQGHALKTIPHHHPHPHRNYYTPATIGTTPVVPTLLIRVDVYTSVASVGILPTVALTAHLP
jgi:hypothetical protein